MNRAKRSHNKNVSKQLRKEVHNAPPLSLKEENLRTDELTLGKLLQKLPKKRAAKEKNLVESAIRRAYGKKEGKQKKTSKRTEPGTAIESAPAMAHREGGRWIKTLQKQTLSENKIFNNHIQKGRRK